MRAPIQLDTVMVLLCLPASVRDLGATRQDRERLSALLRSLASRGIVEVVGTEPPPGGRGGRVAHVFAPTTLGRELMHEARDALARATAALDRGEEAA